MIRKWNKDYGLYVKYVTREEIASEPSGWRRALVEVIVDLVYRVHGDLRRNLA